MLRKSGALIGYARVSKSDQDMSMQLDALKRAGCQQVFQDVASGAKSARQGLDDALAYLRPGDTLVVWKIDRLGRSLVHLVALMQDLSQRKIGFRSVTDAAIDTTSPSGALIFSIFAALASFERELIRERTPAGLVAAKARGRKGGRKPVVTPEILKRAHALQKRGLTVRETVAALKIGKTALYTALAVDRATPKIHAATSKGRAQRDRRVRKAKR